MKCKRCGYERQVNDVFEDEFCTEKCMDEFYTGTSKKQQHKYTNDGYMR